MSSTESAITFDSEVMTGLVVLFVAQLISAIMGLYVQLTYAKYGTHWLENLFYSHFLSIPLFLPFHADLNQQFQTLQLSATSATFSPSTSSQSSNLSKEETQLPLLPILPNPPFMTWEPPALLLTLGLNSLTQYACIRGVNMLAAKTSALGVTIVLNVRKLVSLFISIWWFGNKLPLGVAVGAAIVFGSAGLYGCESGRVMKRGKQQKELEERKKQ